MTTPAKPTAASNVEENQCGFADSATTKTSVEKSTTVEAASSLGGVSYSQPHRVAKKKSDFNSMDEWLHYLEDLLREPDLHFVVQEDGTCTAPAPASSERGSDRPLGNRFVVRDSQIVKIANGEVLPDEEPLFLVRARDHLALPMLHKYREMMVTDGCNDYILNLMDEMLAQFDDFQKRYPERMKQPGITRGK